MTALFLKAVPIFIRNIETNESSISGFDVEVNIN
jgi:hypothetical protein